MSWTRCCWLTTKVTTKARTSGRFWECYRGSTARQPVFLMCCHTTRTRFTKAATGIDCEGRWHSCLCKRSSGFNLTKKNDFFLLYSQIWVPSLVHAQDQLAGEWVLMGLCFFVLFAYWASLAGRKNRKCDRTPIADWPLPVQEVTPQEYRPRCCWTLLGIESTLIYFVRCETSLNISYVYRKCYMVPVICIMAVYGHDKHPRVSTAFFNPCKIVSTVYSLFIFISKIPYKLRLSLI